MLALGHHRSFEAPPAEQTLERQLLFIFDLVVLVILLVVGAFLVLELNLPAMLVVGAIVQELAAQAETTESAVTIVKIEEKKKARLVRLL